MTFDILKILEGKRALRGRLAHLPVAEKLAMLDPLRERARVLRAAARSHAAVAEGRAECKIENKSQKPSSTK